jgi:hypothetical protein
MRKDMDEVANAYEDRDAARANARRLRTALDGATEEIDRLRAVLGNMYAYAKVMNENNWRDLRLYIEHDSKLEK